MKPSTTRRVHQELRCNKRRYVSSAFPISTREDLLLQLARQSRWKKVRQIFMWKELENYNRDQSLQTSEPKSEFTDGESLEIRDMLPCPLGGLEKLIDGSHSSSPSSLIVVNVDNFDPIDGCNPSLPFHQNSARIPTGAAESRTNDANNNSAAHAISTHDQMPV